MDHVSDTNLTMFHKIARQHTLPEFIKSATINHDEINQLPGSSFADPSHRVFPCHTRENSFLSYAYFLKNASHLSSDRRARTWTNLRKFANHWGITIECNLLQKEHEKLAAEDITQLPDETFAIVEDWNGDKYRALPLLNSSCVKAAAEHLVAYKNRYPLEWRKRAATRIAEKAVDFQVEIELPYIHKAAGLYASSSTDIARGMIARAQLVNRERKGDIEQVSFMKAARIIITKSGAAIANKAAKIIDKFDEHYNLKRLYARGLASPEELCWGAVTIKKARELKNEFITLSNGSTYTKKALVSAGLTPYRVLGDDFVNEVRDGLKDVSSDKVASIVPTLPRPDADLLDKAFRASNVKTAAHIRKQADVDNNVSRWSSDDWDRILAAVS